MEDIKKIVKSLEDIRLLLKEVSETIQNETKEQKGGFLDMLLGILGANLLQNMLAGKEPIATSQVWGINRAGDGIIRVGYGSKRYVNKHFWFCLIL